MRRVLLLVEGQTEEAFVDRVLRPHLAPSVFPRATMLRTKELPAGRPFKGGVTNFAHMKRDIGHLLNDSDAVVSTIIDYYGLPDDFPGLQQAKLHPKASVRVTALEQQSIIRGFVRSSPCTSLKPGFLPCRMRRKHILPFRD